MTAVLVEHHLQPKTRTLGETRASIVCNRCGRRPSRWRQDGQRNRDKESERFQAQRGSHCVRAFPEDPNCEVRWMTTTTRGRCKKQTSEPRRWDPLGELITADHKILNLEGVSRNDLGNTLIVQGPYSYCLRSDHSKSKDAQETASCLRRFLPPFRKPGRIFTDNSRTGAV